MMCTHCNRRPATQRELIGTGGDLNKIYLSFANICKECSLFIGYDQNTITAFIEYSKHLVEIGAEILVDKNEQIFPNKEEFTQSIMLFNTEKSHLELSIKKMLKENKGLFFLSLVNGHNAIKGELYLERCKNPGYLALDYPLQNGEHADWVNFKALEDIRESASYKNYINLDYIVKLIEFGSQPFEQVDSSVNDLIENLLKMFKGNVPQVYFIIILTGIENHSGIDLLEKYPLLNHYKSRGQYYFSNNQNNVEKIKIQLKTKIDCDYIYITEKEEIDDNIDVQLHFFICGPFKRNRLFNSIDDDIYSEKFPINIHNK